MEHFISINYSGSVDEKYLAECLASSNRILNEDALEFYTGKVGNVKTIRMPLPEAIENVEETAQELAMRLFEFGLKKFEIELTEATLRRGSRGAEVEALQQKLGVAVDGIYGPNTEAAVRAFQQRAGIQVDGIAGGQTQAALAAGGGPRNAGAPRASTTPFQPGVGSTTQAPPQAQSAAQAPPQAQSAAPQTSPRPQARPNTGGMTDVERDAGAGAVSQTSPPIDGGIATGTTTGGPSQLRQRQDRRRNDQFQNDRIDRMAQQSDDQARRARNAADDDQVMSQPVVAPEPEQVSTGQSDAPVQPVGRMSSARPQGEPSPNVRPGDETNALDAIAADRATLGRNTPPRAAPEPNAQTSVVQPDEPVGTDAAPTIDTTDDPEVNTTSPGGLGSPDGADAAPNISDNPANRDAQRVAAELEAWQEKYGSSTVGAYGLPAEYGQMLDAALDLTPDSAQKLKDESVGAPQAVAVVVLGELRRAYDIDPDADVFRELMNLRREVDNEEPDQAAALTTLAQLARDLQKTANPEQSNESVEPMPKGAFMVEDRAIWRSLYESTHYTNGKPRPRTFISESKRTIPEITFEDDDKFFENYGVMWFNEDDVIDEAEYQGRKVKLGKPMAGDVKKFKVYVKNPKGNVVKVNFGQKGAKIKKNNPERRRSFRARHNCDNPGPRHKARYWSCRKW